MKKYILSFIVLSMFIPALSYAAPLHGQGWMISQLHIQITNLTNQITGLNSQITSLQAQIASLQAQNQALQNNQCTSPAPAPVIDLGMKKSNLFIQYETSHRKPDCSSNAGIAAAGFAGLHGMTASSFVQCRNAASNYKLNEETWVKSQM